jgi:hypothetical protein
LLKIGMDLKLAGCPTGRPESPNVEYSTEGGPAAHATAAAAGRERACRGHFRPGG